LERRLSGLLEEPADATPLTKDEQQGLIPTWITTRADLNHAERDNILRGLVWARRRKALPSEMVTDAFSMRLHKAMFGEVWNWAGAYRKTDKNIGTQWWRVPLECAELFDTIRYWIDHETYQPDELAVRFHHMLVSIHPFPNGNGRHSRMMADLLVERLNRQPFTWGRGNLVEGELRHTYIRALRDADENDIRSLLAFSRS
jgi:Fic-DOC domain mobile mystery protein B